MGKIRACGDLKYGRANLACSTRTPISLPTWGHIGQIFLGISTTDQPLAFPKADHKAAYKNLPLNPAQADACIVTLGNTSGGLLYGLRPRTLLFGAVAAAIHYNCYSRIIAMFANLILGIPIANYFDDIGSMWGSSIPEDALATFSDFCRISVVILKEAKTGLCRQSTFVGLDGLFPFPGNGAILSVNSTGGSLWAGRLGNSSGLDTSCATNWNLPPGDSHIRKLRFSAVSAGV